MRPKITIPRGTSFSFYIGKEVKHNSFMDVIMTLNAKLNRTRRLGVEHELTMPRMGNSSGADVQNTLAEILTANGLPAISRGYSHQIIQQGYDLAVECDSSIRGHSEWQNVPYASIELKSRILNGIDDWERIVPKALQICRDLGGKINHTAGFHVHLELNEVFDNYTIIRSLFNLFHRYEQVIYGLVAPSRTNNNYCKAIPPESSRLFKGCRAWRSYNRQIKTLHCKNGLNLSHLCNSNYVNTRPHVEFRYSSGTLNADKARYWIRFLLQMIEHAVKRNCQASNEQVTNDRRGLEKLLVSSGFKVNNNIYSQVCPELRETGKFLINRWKHFNGKISLKDCKSFAGKST